MRSKFIYFFLFCTTLVHLGLLLTRQTLHQFSPHLLWHQWYSNRINGIGGSSFNVYFRFNSWFSCLSVCSLFFSLILISLFVSISLTRYISVILVSFIASLTFFLITNFSVWVIWDYYLKHFMG